MKNVPPKVFISYASEDLLFAKDLATKLLAKGLEVWLAEWELLPGDSLIDKVFEEGLKNADFVIVILSAASVDKPWVRAELNVATVKRINGMTKLIPVVLDDCTIPESLSATVWKRIKDKHSYDIELETIVRAIFNFRDKPALGKAPAYTTTIAKSIPGLTKTDSLVLKLVGGVALKKGTGIVHSETMLEKTRAQDISDEATVESLTALERDGYLNIKHVHNTSKLFHSVTMTGFGIEEYASNYLDGYSSLPKDVVHKIVNLGQVDSTEISTALNEPILLINHIVESLENRRLFKLIKSHTGDYNRHIYQISPLLKRELD